MMLKLHECSHEIWFKNVIFKYKNYVPHLLFHFQIVVFRNSFFRHLNKALIILKIYLIQNNFGFIQDFKLGGGGLKKIAPSGGVFRLKNHDFTPKNHIFSNFRRGARRLRPQDSPLGHQFRNLLTLILVLILKK
jgi:hypothetical protein